MNKENIKKVVLAYSGGLDTSIIIPWLKENYNKLTRPPVVMIKDGKDRVVVRRETFEDLARLDV